MRPAPPPAYTSSWFWAWAICCSVCQRSACDSPRSIRSSSACASSSCSWARRGSISRASTASSTRASARSCSTLKNPAPVANSRISSSRRMCTRVPPALSVATSGACRARIPISPAAPGTISISTSPSNAGPSGVTSERSNVRRSCATAYLGWNRRFFPSLFRLLRRLLGRLLGFGLAAALARLLDCLLDRPDHVERLLGQLVVLAVEDLLEAFDRVLELHVLAGCPRELLRDEVRLREEARRVKVGERVGGRRIGQVVGRDVDRLHRRDRACPRRRDALLELAHLGRHGRLVADG